MKFTVDTKPLRDAMGIAGGVIPKKSTWPIVLNLHVTAEGNQITLRGTDIDLTYEADVPASVEAGGSALIPFTILQQFVSKAKGDDVSVEVSGNQAVVKSGRGRITLSAGDVTDFPNTEPKDGSDLYTVDRDTFLKALRFCGNAAAEDEVKFNIQGVYIEEHGGGLDFWGTDSFVMNHARMEGPKEIGGGGQIPQQAIVTISAMSAKTEALRFMVNGKGWRIEIDNARAWGKVIDAKYPDARSLLDRSRGAVKPIANVSAPELVQGVDVAVCGADEASGRVRHIVVRADADGPLVLRGYRPGSAVVKAGRIELDADIKSPFAVAISANYLRETVQGMGAGGTAISSDGVMLHLTPEQESATINLESLIHGIRAKTEDLADA